MPTYEYVCEKCGHQFEKVQSIAAKPLAVCPEDLCGRKRWGKGKVKRLLSTGGGLIFKGSGFYVTDYRSENYKQAAKKDVPASTSGRLRKRAATGRPPRGWATPTPGPTSRNIAAPRGLRGPSPPRDSSPPFCRRRNSSAEFLQALST